MKHDVTVTLGLHEISYLAGLDINNLPCAFTYTSTVCVRAAAGRTIYFDL